MLKSFKYAFEGIFSAIKKERNMKIHIAMMLAVIVAGIIFSISKIEWICCLFCFGLVISLEMVNTAIEVLADLVDEKYNEKIKLIKDVAAGAVLVSAIISAIIGLMIFIPKLLEVL